MEWQVFEGTREEASLDGLVFTDGSAYGGGLPHSRRAGWAVVKINPNTGAPMVVMNGPVWSNLPQTNACGEHVALVAALQGQTQASITKVHTDFLGLLQLKEAT